MKTNWEWILQGLRSDRAALSLLLASTQSCLRWYFDFEKPESKQAIIYWNEACAILDELSCWDFKSFDAGI